MSISSISFDAAALLCSLMLFFFAITDRIQRRVERSIFLLMLLNNILACLCNVLDFNFWRTALYHGNAVQANLSREICDMIFYASQISLAPLYVMYLVSLTGAQHVLKKRHHVMIMTPFFVMLAMILTNPWHHGYFYLDAYAGYHRGPLVFLVYVEVFIYILFGIFFVYRYGKNMQTKKKAALLSSIVFASVGSVIQYLVPWLMVELLCITLSYMAVFLFVEYAKSEYDVACKCYNRYGFIEEVQKMLAIGLEYTIISFRIINFSEHEKVIEVEALQKMSEEIVSFLREQNPMNKIYTCDRAQFCIILQDGRKEEVSRIRETILSRMKQGWEVCGQEIDLQVSLSTFVIPKDFSNLRDIMNAVTRRYNKKGHQVTVYEGKDLNFLVRERYIETLLDEALDNGTFEVWFQPIYSFEKKRYVAAEALARLRDRDGSLISPGEFIPIAEKSPVILKLGRYVLEETCRAFKEYRLLEKGIQYIEINVAQRQLYHTGIGEEFKEIVEGYNVPFSCINLEITETVAEDESKRIKKVLEGLKEVGFSFSLDDFGTGYSNMSRLFNREFRNIKLDRSLLLKAQKNQSAGRFLEALPGIVHSMNAKIIQEGVETEEQLEYVRRMESDMIQGFYFSKPLPMKDFADLVEEM
ncbi:EAL domain, c-di-GMP-specific phosphodiesterase class I (or its enzymatically inactive variant) [Lachnospiraceae bacterium C10]|nr:EAL domain, c-di-GMP-specific phosphodiesterase class I (or its enzymatically inactive variant) [Lachnospiraceae bacterium C10]